MVYARGGYANCRIQTSLTILAGTATVSESCDGWLVGGGEEREFVTLVAARIEYRYTDLSEGESKFDRHQTMLGITYRI